MLDIRFDQLPPFVAVAPGALPTLRLKLLIRATRDTGNVPPGDSGSHEALISMQPRLTLNGVPLQNVLLENGPRFGDPPGHFVHHEVTWTVVVPRDILRTIESTRKDDVQVDFSCQMNFWGAGGLPPSRQFFSTYPSVQAKLSQKDWSEILQGLGYYGAWIVEIPRPVTGSLDSAATFLESARKRIQADDATGALSDLRKAWDAADPALDAHPEARDREVDGLSTGEATEPTKAKRIGEARRWIDKFCQIGPHSDLYEVTMDDALLAYRLTTSLVAYLSKKAQDSQRRAPV